MDILSIKYENLLLAGVDEVGRGPLAGDVIAAAVILDPKVTILGLADSKKISEKNLLVGIFFFLPLITLLSFDLLVNDW